MHRERARRRRGRGDRLDDHRPRLPDLGAPLRGRRLRGAGCPGPALSGRGAGPAARRDARPGPVARRGRRRGGGGLGSRAGPRQPPAARGPGERRAAEVVALWTYLYATRSSRSRWWRTDRCWCPWPTTSRCSASVSRAGWCARPGPGLHHPGGASTGRRPPRDRRPPWAEVGTGLDPSPEGDAGRARSALVAATRFALYVGRVDRPRAWTASCARTAPIGRPGRAGPRPRRPTRADDRASPVGSSRPVSSTSDARADLLAACEVVALPSRYESLSLVALEAWRAGRPTLATSRSEVVAGRRPAPGAACSTATPRATARNWRASPTIRRSAIARVERSRVGGGSHVARRGPPLAGAPRPGAAADRRRVRRARASPLATGLRRTARSDLAVGTREGGSWRSIVGVTVTG